MIELFTARVSDFTKEQLNAEYRCQTDAVKSRIDKKNEKGKEESLSALCLLRRAIKKVFGGTDYTVKYNENGKPFTDKCFVSLSHSGGFVACALSDKNIGLDIEVLKNIKRRDVYIFFTDREKNYVNENPRLLSQRFLEIWTKKEAAVKFYSSRLCNCADIDTFNLPKTLSVLTKWQDNLVISVCVEV